MGFNSGFKGLKYLILVLPGAPFFCCFVYTDPAMYPTGTTVSEKQRVVWMAGWTLTSNQHCCKENSLPWCLPNILLSTCDTYANGTCRLPYCVDLCLQNASHGVGIHKRRE